MEQSVTFAHYGYKAGLQTHPSGYLSESGHKKHTTLCLLPVCEDLQDSWATSTGLLQEIHLPPVFFLKALFGYAPAFVYAGEGYL